MRLHIGFHLKFQGTLYLSAFMTIFTSCFCIHYFLDSVFKKKRTYVNYCPTIHFLSIWLPMQNIFFYHSVKGRLIRDIDRGYFLRASSLTKSLDNRADSVRIKILVQHHCTLEVSVIKLTRIKNLLQWSMYSKEVL